MKWYTRWAAARPLPLCTVLAGADDGADCDFLEGDARPGHGVRGANARCHCAPFLQALMAALIVVTSRAMQSWHGVHGPSMGPHTCQATASPECLHKHSMNRGNNTLGRCQRRTTSKHFLPLLHSQENTLYLFITMLLLAAVCPFRTC